MAVAEIPLLFETGGESRFDKVVVITAPAEVRVERRGEFADREERLVPEEEKIRRADFAYVNDGTLEELDAFVAGVLEELTAPLRNWLAAVGVVGVLIGVFFYLQNTEPAWYARLWYPLRYQTIVRQYAHAAAARPGAARRGDRDREQVQSRARARAPARSASCS